MDTAPFNPAQIVDRLNRYNYKYEVDGQMLRISLPMLCYLKIDFKSDKVKMTSHIRFGVPSLALEYNLLIYGLVLYVLAWYFWSTLNKAIFILLGLFVVYIVVCFIKTEALKVIVHNWIEIDNNSK